MVDSFSALKRSRESALDRLTKEAANLTNKFQKQVDDRFWQPQTDKSGNGYAVVRFLPAPPGEDVPWVRIWNHGFQGPGGWYIENSLTTIGKPDPVYELNAQLYQKANKNEEAPEFKQAQRQKRRLGYIANVLVIKDAANPENEGKVFLYKFGKKIFDKINAKMNPEYEDDVAINPFDPWTGCNFKLKIRKVGEFRNYDHSEFDAPTQLAKDDADIERIWKQEHSLQAFLAPTNFKSYDELKRRLDSVLSSAGKRADREDDAGDDGVDVFLKGSAGAVAEPKVGKSVAIDDDDDDLARFRALAEDESD